MRTQEIAALFERVRQFERLELPGQPKMMHMGTSYLVTELFAALEREAARCSELEQWKADATKTLEKAEKYLAARLVDARP